MTYVNLQQPQAFLAPVLEISFKGCTFVVYPLRAIVESCYAWMIGLVTQIEKLVGGGTFGDADQDERLAICPQLGKLFTSYLPQFKLLNLSCLHIRGDVGGCIQLSQIEKPHLM